MKKTIATLSGNFLEFYDFTLFSYMIPIIAPILFPNSDIINSYIVGYIFLAVGFVARPLGGLMFGIIGDKFGRRIALLLSVLLMAVATGGIGLLPGGDNSYLVLILLSILRIMQGLSAGGEYSGAGLTLIEDPGAKSKYLLGAVLTSAGLCGAFLASIAAACVNMFDAPWLWRVLFLGGGVLGLIVFYLRFSIKDNENNTKIIGVSPKQQNAGWRELRLKYWRPLLYIVLCSGLMNVPFYMTTAFLNTYLIAVGTFAKLHLMFINAGVVLFYAIITVLFGILSNFVNPKKMMIYASFGITAFAFPFFWLIESGSTTLFIVGELTLAILSQIFVAPAFTIMASIFPYHLRYRGMATANCLGIALLGGTTPYLSSQLVAYTGISWSPAFYLCLIAFLGFVTSVLISKQKIYAFNNSDTKIDETQQSIEIYNGVTI